ncbi:MAG: SDR family oxidoreductase [Candidatus Eremiobacteraeota bacterium]|nr:SDR family oxidoreductase [Candidatus Eremiobacteraeota bacterium]
MAGKTAIVTGGGTGMGRAIALELGRLGANVVVASRKQAVIDAAAAEIERRGGSGAAIAVDVREPKLVDALVEQTLERFGGIDILVNNAAGNFPVRALELTPNGWRAVVEIVLNGTWFCSQAVAKAMIAGQRAGSMINVIATYAWHGQPGTVHSAAAKAGVLALTQSLAVEWSPHRIRSNAIAPGAIADTGGFEILIGDAERAERVRRSIPAQRFGHVQEIANIAAFLASDYSDYVNGACITADGARWLAGSAYRFM